MAACRVLASLMPKRHRKRLPRCKTVLRHAHDYGHHITVSPADFLDQIDSGQRTAGRRQVTAARALVNYFVAVWELIERGQEA
jgi:hypothetical protein